MVTIKQGDTIVFAGLHTDDNDEAYELTNVDIAADITISTIRQAFIITKSNQALYPGQFVMEIDELITIDLPLGKYECDIKYTEDSVVTRTDTFNIDLIEAVTL